MVSLKRSPKSPVGGVSLSFILISLVLAIGPVYAAAIDVDQSSLVSTTQQQRAALAKQEDEEEAAAATVIAAIKNPQAAKQASVADGDVPIEAQGVIRRIFSFPGLLSKDHNFHSINSDEEDEEDEDDYDAEFDYENRQPSFIDEKWVDGIEAAETVNVNSEIIDEPTEGDDDYDDCDNGDDSDDGSQWHVNEKEDDYDDCDNGDDSDDGSQWHVQQEELDPASGFQRPVRTRFSRTTSQGLTPFPQWLTDITNLTQWPGYESKYIPIAGIDLGNVPNVPIRELGDCSKVTLDHCSFDCHRCLALDEIMSCPVLSQTFDDGPSPATPKLLEQLPGKTTFFTQGINVVRFPDTFRLQHAKGHLLASHTWSHANLAGVSNEDIAAQIQWSIWAMNATAGIVPRYFRPPYGASDNRVRHIARQFGLISVFWDHDTFDWQVNDKKKIPLQILDEVSSWRAQNPNGLILEHDSTIDTVNVGVDVSKMLGEKQYTVAECVNGQWYQDIQCAKFFKEQKRCVQETTCELWLMFDIC